MTSTNFLGLLAPSPSVRKVYILFVGAFFTTLPPLPFYADVIHLLMFHKLRFTFGSFMKLVGGLQNKMH